MYKIKRKIIYSHHLNLVSFKFFSFVSVYLNNFDLGLYQDRISLHI